MHLFDIKLSREFNIFRVSTIQMETTQRNLDFCNEFTFFDPYYIDPVKVIGIVNDMSLKIIADDVEQTGFDVSNLRAAILKTLCLENLYKEEAANKNEKSTIGLGGVAVFDQPKNESFLNLEWFF